MGELPYLRDNTGTNRTRTAFSEATHIMELVLKPLPPPQADAFATVMADLVEADTTPHVQGAAHTNGAMETRRSDDNTPQQHRHNDSKTGETETVGNEDDVDDHVTSVVLSKAHMAEALAAIERSAMEVMFKSKAQREQEDESLQTFSSLAWRMVFHACAERVCVALGCDPDALGLEEGQWSLRATLDRMQDTAAMLARFCSRVMTQTPPSGTSPCSSKERSEDTYTMFHSLRSLLRQEVQAIRNALAHTYRDQRSALARFAQDGVRAVRTARTEWRRVELAECHMQRVISKKCAEAIRILHDAHRAHTMRTKAAVSPVPSTGDTQAVSTAPPLQVEHDAIAVDIQRCIQARLALEAQRVALLSRSSTLPPATLAAQLRTIEHQLQSKAQRIRLLETKRRDTGRRAAANAAASTPTELPLAGHGDAADDGDNTEQALCVEVAVRREVSKVDTYQAALLRQLTEEVAAARRHILHHFRATMMERQTRLQQEFHARVRQHQERLLRTRQPIGPLVDAVAQQLAVLGCTPDVARMRAAATHRANSASCRHIESWVQEVERMCALLQKALDR